MLHPERHGRPLRAFGRDKAVELHDAVACTNADTNIVAPVFKTQNNSGRDPSAIAAVLIKVADPNLSLGELDGCEEGKYSGQ